MSKKFLAGVFAVAAFAFAITVSAAYDFGATTLRVGSKGEAVKNVQIVVGATPVDGIFGAMTKAKVMAWQAANGLTPVDGIFGPMSKAKANAVVGTTPSTPTTPTTPSTLSGDEADVSIDADADDDLVNNKSGQLAFVVEVEADDRGGDAKIERMDLAFTITPKSGGEDDIYDIIEAVTLESNGKEIASEDTDSRSDWDDSDNASGAEYVRLSGLNLIVKSGDTAEIEVLLDIADLDTTDDLSLDIELSNVEIRYSDGAGVVETLDKDFSESVKVEEVDAIDFDIDEASNNPSSVTVSLNEDRDDVLVLVNDVEVDGQDGTIEEVVLTFTLESGSATIASQDALEDLISQIYLNGDKADDIDLVTGGASFTATYETEDWEVEVGDDFEVEVSIDFNEEDYSGEFKLTGIKFEGEGFDGDDFSKSLTSDSAPVVTLTSGALILEDSKVSGYTAMSSNNQAAKATFEVSLENDGDDDVKLAISTTGTDPYAAFAFTVNGVEYFAKSNGTLTTTEEGATALAGYTLTIKDSEGDALSSSVAGNAVIEDGKSETYVITITADANATDRGTGEYEIELSEISYVVDATTDEEVILTVNLEANEIDLIDNK